MSAQSGSEFSSSALADAPTSSAAPARSPTARGIPTARPPAAGRTTSAARGTAAAASTSSLAAATAVSAPAAPKPPLSRKGKGPATRSAAGPANQRLLLRPQDPARRYIAPPAPRIGHIQPATARAAEQREQRRIAKTIPEGKYVCKPCGVLCNSLTVLRDHLWSRRHRNTVNRPDTRPRCDVCDREFETVEHFERNQRGQDHHRSLARCTD